MPRSRRSYMEVTSGIWRPRPVRRPAEPERPTSRLFLWFPFVQAAVYNAVNGITGEYELYKWNAKAPKGASPQAAAAAAAHGVLMEYFGTNDFVNSEAIAANLNAALATSLGQIPNGVRKQQASATANALPSVSSSFERTMVASHRSCSTCR